MYSRRSSRRSVKLAASVGKSGLTMEILPVGTNVLLAPVNTFLNIHSALCTQLGTSCCMILVNLSSVYSGAGQSALLKFTYVRPSEVVLMGRWSWLSEWPSLRSYPRLCGQGPFNSAPGSYRGVLFKFIQIAYFEANFEPQKL